jgi:hypothetical protein
MPAWYYFARPDNLSCHNLCSILKPPMNVRSLLGLGLNFCPRPRYSNHIITKELERFERDIYVKAFMAELKKPIPRLYQRSDWKPPEKLINFSLKRRTSVFKMKLNKMFKKRK